MAVVRLLCISGCSTSSIKARWKYVVSKAHIWFKYGKSTVNYSKSIVLYGNFLAPTVHQSIIYWLILPLLMLIVTGQLC